MKLKTGKRRMGNSKKYARESLSTITRAGPTLGGGPELALKGKWNQSEQQGFRGCLHTRVA